MPSVPELEDPSMEAILAFVQEQIKIENDTNPYLEVYESIKRISERIAQIAEEVRRADPTELWLHVRCAEKLIRENDLLKNEIQKIIAIILKRHDMPTLFFSREEGAQ